MMDDYNPGPAILGEHSHNLTGKPNPSDADMTPCADLSHCPALCDCPADNCTAK